MDCFSISRLTLCVSFAVTKNSHPLFLTIGALLHLQELHRFVTSGHIFIAASLPSETDRQTYRCSKFVAESVRAWAVGERQVVAAVLAVVGVVALSEPVVIASSSVPFSRIQRSDSAQTHPNRRRTVPQPPSAF